MKVWKTDIRRFLTYFLMKYKGKIICRVLYYFVKVKEKVLLYTILCYKCYDENAQKKKYPWINFRKWLKKKKIPNILIMWLHLEETLTGFDGNIVKGDFNILNTFIFSKIMYINLELYINLEINFFKIQIAFWMH